MDERWRQFGEEQYLKELVNVVDTLEDLADRSSTFREVRDTAMVYVERELERARLAYIEAGGKPQPTKAEIKHAHAEMDFRFGSGE